MKVKIGDKIYDSETEPIMIILEPDDKTNIASMTEKARKYCSFPHEGFSVEDIKNFMKLED